MIRDLIQQLDLHKRAQNLNARARANGVVGDLDRMALVQMLMRSGGRCAWCDKPLTDPEDIEIEHILPFRLAGDNTPQNLAIACCDCNRRKAEKHPARFAQEQSSKGIHTPLIDRILAEQGIHPTSQPSLFDHEDGDPGV